MRKRINSEAGFTLVEMLAAVVVMVLLALMAGVGFQMAYNSYQTVVAKSEVDLLLSTAIDALADDLRYAQNVKDSSDKDVPFTYTSDSFGKNTHLTLDETTHQIIAKSDNWPEGARVLSTGSYGAQESDDTTRTRAYKVKSMTIWYENNTFTIYLKVATADESISAETTVTVRCLNPPKDTTTPTS